MSGTPTVFLCLSLCSPSICSMSFPHSFQYRHASCERLLFLTFNLLLSSLAGMSSCMHSILYILLSSLAGKYSCNYLCLVFNLLSSLAVLDSLIRASRSKGLRRYQHIIIVLQRHCNHDRGMDVSYSRYFTSWLYFT